jgi:NAD(P)H dehydrogenase (quinone)
MKVGVTGISGQLGNAIATQLIADLGAENVVGYARNPGKVKLPVEVFPADYTKADDWLDYLEGVDVLFIVSGNVAPLDRIEQHRNIIRGAQKNALKKLVYTSIIGMEDESSFRDVVQSNRQTEKDIIDSGMHYCIGRNNIYIEPDLEYVDNYVKQGKISNCAGDGKCGYTSRPELARAYSKLIVEEKFNDGIYNLGGKPISQIDLTKAINKGFATELKFESMSIEAYQKERQAELGEFLGGIIAGIYEGIALGANDVPSDFEKIVGRRHKTPDQMIKEFKS